MAEEGRSLRWGCTLGLGALALLLFAGATFAFLYSASEGVGKRLVSFVMRDLDPPSANHDEVVFVVHPGENAAQIASRLEEEGIINNAALFRLLARTRELDQHLEAGEHSLRRGMTVEQALQGLRRADIRQRAITLLEGWRVEELAEEVAFHNLATEQEFLDLIAEGRWNHAFLADRPPGAVLEGYLFPDTYFLDDTMTAETLVDRMLTNFARQVLPEWNSRAPDLELNLHEVITLAAIVEREAVVAAERPLIAAVFLNRLRSGMPLQADPTVQYAIVTSPSRPPEGFWKRGLTIDDLATESPYNTYVVTGLPPSPICNPGLPAIKSVLKPAEVDYLYFVARGDGSHAFALTYDEHLDNVERYRR